MGCGGRVEPCCRWRAQVVYGNARTNGGTITCQHGAEECLDNVLQTCGIAHSTGPAQWLPYIHCMETYGSTQRQHAQSCATAAGISWTAVDACFKGTEGQTLELAAGNATASLVPAHQFVPWVTLSDAEGAGTFCDESGCDGFLQAVCDAYTGTPPAACAQTGSATGLRGRGTGGVCKRAE